MLKYAICLLQLKMSVLEDELDKRANEAEHTMGRAGFANSQLGGMSCFSGAPTHPTTVRLCQKKIKSRLCAHWRLLGSANACGHGLLSLH